MNESIIFYAGLALGLLNLVLSIATLNPYLILIGIMATFCLFALYKLWYIIEPLLIRKTNIIQVVGDYELTGTRGAAIRSHGGAFYATAVAALEPSRSDIDRARIEEIISRSNTPFKFVLQLEKLNPKNISEKLQTKRNMKEIALSRIGGGSSIRNTQKINALKREIEQLEQDIRSISTGSSPVRLAQYLMCGTSAESKYLAEERARSQVREMAGQLGALMGSQSRVLEGRELLDMLSMDSMVAK
ncbi:MAG TPA: hypothetical protein VND15_01985 [Candidatus Acidoferrales bacterium]|nr:hypothetical protein [Candidatus Acidoferrales bacterium]